MTPPPPLSVLSSLERLFVHILWWTRLCYSTTTKKNVFSFILLATVLACLCILGWTCWVSCISECYYVLSNHISFNYSLFLIIALLSLLLFSRHTRVAWWSLILNSCTLSASLRTLACFQFVLKLARSWLFLSSVDKGILQACVSSDIVVNFCSTHSLLPEMSLSRCFWLSTLTVLILV